MFKAPDKYRITVGNLKSSNADGNNGVFLIPCKKKLIKAQEYLQIYSSDKKGWERVTVIVTYKSGNQVKRKPIFEEMDFVKNVFWNNTDKPEVVVQFFIPEEFIINKNPFACHLWKKIGAIYEIPVY